MQSFHVDELCINLIAFVLLSETAYKIISKIKRIKKDANILPRRLTMHGCINCFILT